MSVPCGTRVRGVVTSRTGNRYKTENPVACLLTTTLTPLDSAGKCTSERFQWNSFQSNPEGRCRDVQRLDRVGCASEPHPSLRRFLWCGAPVIVPIGRTGRYPRRDSNSHWPVPETGASTVGLQGRGDCRGSNPDFQSHILVSWPLDDSHRKPRPRGVVWPNMAEPTGLEPAIFTVTG